MIFYATSLDLIKPPSGLKKTFSGHLLLQTGTRSHTLQDAEQNAKKNYERPRKLYRKCVVKYI